LVKDDCQIYDCITPLRLVLAIQQNAILKAALSILEHHPGHRQQVGIWQVDRLSVVEPVRLRWGLEDSISEEELQTAWYTF